MEAGTSWLDVADGVVSEGAKMLDGTVSVSLDGDIYTIIFESSTVNARYVGELSL